MAMSCRRAPRCCWRGGCWRRRRDGRCPRWCSSRAPWCTARGPTTPVPLTEDAPLRPNPDLRFAVEKAEIERLAGEWREDHPAATVALLRPAPAVAEDVAEGWLPRALDAVARLPSGDDDPPSQWLHFDDLAAAVRGGPAGAHRRSGERGARRLARCARPPGARRADRPGAGARAGGGASGHVAVAPRPGAQPTRDPALRPSSLGRGQRSPRGGRVEAHPQQRGGVRRRPRSGTTRRPEPSPSPGAGHRRRGHGHRGGRRWCGRVRGPAAIAGAAARVGDAATYRRSSAVLRLR